MTNRLTYDVGAIDRALTHHNGIPGFTYLGLRQDDRKTAFAVVLNDRRRDLNPREASIVADALAVGRRATQ